MNEEALKQLYTLSKEEGYNKTFEEFKSLMSQNSDAVNTMYKTAQSNGYEKNIESFEILVGLKKKENLQDISPMEDMASPTEITFSDASKIIEKDEEVAISEVNSLLAGKGFSVQETGAGDALKIVDNITGVETEIDLQPIDFFGGNEEKEKQTNKLLALVNSKNTLKRRALSDNTLSGFIENKNKYLAKLEDDFPQFTFERTPEGVKVSKGDSTETFDFFVGQGGGATATEKFSKINKFIFDNIDDKEASEIYKNKSAKTYIKTMKDIDAIKSKVDISDEVVSKDVYNKDYFSKLFIRLEAEGIEFNPEARKELEKGQTYEPATEYDPGSLKDFNEQDIKNGIRKYFSNNSEALKVINNFEKYERSSVLKQKIDRATKLKIENYYDNLPNREGVRQLVLQKNKDINSKEADVITRLELAKSDYVGMFSYAKEKIASIVKNNPELSVKLQYDESSNLISISYSEKNKELELLQNQINQRLSDFTNLIKKSELDLGEMNSGKENIEYFLDASKRNYNNIDIAYTDLKNASKGLAGDFITVASLAKEGLGLEGINIGGVTLPVELLRSQVSAEKQKDMERVDQFYETKRTYDEVDGLGNAMVFSLRELATQTPNIALAIATSGAGTSLGLSRAAISTLVSTQFGVSSAGAKYDELTTRQNYAKTAKKGLKELELIKENISTQEYLSQKYELERAIEDGNITPLQKTGAVLATGAIEFGVSRFIGTVPNSINVIKNFKKPGKFLDDILMSNRKSVLKKLGEAGGKVTKATVGEIVEEESIEILGQVSDFALLGDKVDFSNLDDILVTSVITSGAMNVPGIAYSSIVTNINNKRYNSKIESNITRINELKKLLKNPDLKESNRKSIHANITNEIIKISNVASEMEADALLVGADNIKELLVMSDVERSLYKKAGIKPYDSEQIKQAKIKSHVDSLDKEDGQQYKDNLKYISEKRNEILGDLNYETAIEEVFGEKGKEIAEELDDKLSPKEKYTKVYEAIKDDINKESVKEYNKIKEVVDFANRMDENPDSLTDEEFNFYTENKDLVDRVITERKDQRKKQELFTLTNKVITNPDNLSEAESKLYEDNKESVDKNIEDIKKANPDVVNQVIAAKKALSGVLGDVTFKLYESEQEYADTTGEEVGDTSSGEYSVEKKQISINLSNATSTTVAHEVFHAILLSKGMSDKEATRLTNSMLKSAYKFTSKDLKKKITDFSKGYKKSLQSEESMAELFGILSSEYKTLNKQDQGIIKRFLDKLAKLFKLKQFTDAEVVDLLNVLSRKVARGQKIKSEDVKVISEKNSKFAKKKIQRYGRDRKRITELSKLLETYTKETSKTRGIDKRNVRKTERVGSVDLDIIAEYDLNNIVDDGITKVFPRFQGVQKVYEITNGKAYRKLMVSSLKNSPFASSVTVHKESEFNEMRMFVTEDGSTGVTMDKEGFLGGAFSNGSRKNNLSQLMVLGIKEGATTVEAFHTILPDYYTKFGFKAVAKTSFNDDYKPMISNGYSLKDWDYDTYKEFNNGRPDVVFFIYDGGDRNTIEDRLDTFGEYQENTVKAFDKEGYVDAENFMQQKAVESFTTQETQDFSVLDNISNTPEDWGSSSDRKQLRTKPDPKTTIKAYKLFRVSEDQPGKIFPLFVDANTPVEVGLWIDADMAEGYSFQGKNGHFYIPSTSYETVNESTGKKEKRKTGAKIEIPNDKVKQELIDGGFLPKGSNAKNITSLARRPGWHAGDSPMSTHLGSKTGGSNIVNTRSSNQVWAEIEVPADVDWQEIANSEASFKKNGDMIVKSAQITDRIPEDGYYKYKTNPTMTGSWIISGAIKVNRILSDEQVAEINNDFGVKDLDRLKPMDLSKYGFKAEKSPEGRVRKQTFLTEDVNKALEEKASQKNKVKATRKIREKILDRQTRIKDLLKGIGSKESQRTHDLLVTRAGASGNASLRFKEADEKIYNGLSKTDIVDLNEVIYLKRIISINKNRVKNKRPLYVGYKGIDSTKAVSMLNTIKAQVGSEKFNVLKERADVYFDVFNESLKRMYDAQLISEDVYNKLKDEEYSPIKTIKYLIPDNINDTEASRISSITGLAPDVIKTLSNENKNEIILDSRWLLQSNISMIESRVFENRLFNSFFDAYNELSKEEKDSFSNIIKENPVVGKTKAGKPIFLYDNTPVPQGFAKLEFVKDGIKTSLVMDQAYANQLLDLKKDQGNISQWVKKLTLVNVLRFMATSGNPLFIVGNTAVDFTNILLLSNTYSNNKFVAAPELAYDFIKNSLRKGFGTKEYKEIYKEFIEHGGSMDFLSSDGLKAIQGIKSENYVVNAATSTMKGIGGLLSYLGETSELSFRLAVYEKAKQNNIKKFEKENNRKPTEKELQDIMFSSARESRETIDFNQGGSVVKQFDQVFPYLNAATQGFRKGVDFANDNPKQFASNVLQFMIFSGGLAAASMMMLFKALDDEDDVNDVFKSISQYEKSNYHIFFTGKRTEDGEFDYIRVKKLPLLSVAATMAEQLTIKTLMSSRGIDYDMNTEALGKSIESALPFVPTLKNVLTRNPVLSALITGYTNYDLFYDQEVFRNPKNLKLEDRAKGAYDDRVATIYKDLGNVFDFSPKIAQASIEKIITSENTNPLVGLFYSGYDKMFKEDTELGKELDGVVNNVLKSSKRKVLRTTNKKLITYAEDDFAEMEEKAIETEIYRKETKIKNAIKNNDLTQKELKDLIVENFEPIDYKRYWKKFTTYARTKDVDYSILDIIYEQNPEVQGLKLYNKFGADLDDKEKRELSKVFRAAKRKWSKKGLYYYKKKIREMEK